VDGSFFDDLLDEHPIDSLFFWWGVGELKSLTSSKEQKNIKREEMSVVVDRSAFY
jgi:hypothetical protein